MCIRDRFPGATVSIEPDNGRFELQFKQHGLLRPLSQSELSDGTLRYLLWIAALLTPRPPALMVLNEPETSLHPDLLPALSRLMTKFSEETQLWVISHDQVLIEGLKQQQGCNHIGLDKEMGETFAHDQDLFERPPWRWPTR